jgi:bifunctional non-homologous end joining protein LigD
MTKRATRKTTVKKGAAKKSTTKKSAPKKAVAKKAVAKKAVAGKAPAKVGSNGPSGVAQQIEARQAASGAGTLRVTSRSTLDVTSLGKVFFPETGHTKGDVMRYYARVAGVLLPLIADRPLVLKRYPNGVAGPSFYQQNAPDEVPPAVRTEIITSDKGERQSRFVGGDLATLLYTVQIGNISVDPWHSRVQSLDFADYMVLDLDPGDDATFQRVVDVARWVRDELDALGLHGALKTSGSTGLHIYVPLPPKTTDETSRDLAEVIASRVASAHPKEATVERSVKARARGTIYVDWLQNVKGKTVAGPYALRARPRATVSTPLHWEELDDRLDPLDFTIDSVPDRIAREGDLWGPAMKRRNSFGRLLSQLGKGRAGR